MLFSGIVVCSAKRWLSFTFDCKLVDFFFYFSCLLVFSWCSPGVLFFVDKFIGVLSYQLLPLCSLCAVSCAAFLLCPSQGMGESNATVNSRPRVSRETMLAAAAAYQGKPGSTSSYGGPDNTLIFDWVEMVDLSGERLGTGCLDATVVGRCLSLCADLVDGPLTEQYWPEQAVDDFACVCK